MRNRFLSFLCAFAALAWNHSVAPAGSELAKTLNPIVAAESYQFTVQLGKTQPAVEAKYQKGVPLFVYADRIEFFRKGDILVYQQGNVWQRTRTGTLSDPLRILGASAKVRALRLPHEELAALSKALMKIKKDATMISGELSADTARALARTEDRDLARGGAAKLWLDAQGHATKYEIAIRIQGRRGNADVDGVVTHTVSLTAVGMTKVDVPADAKKALE